MSENRRISEAESKAYSTLAEGRKKRLRTAIFYIGGLVIGALIGVLNIDAVNELMGFIATVFTRLFSLVAVPVIALSLITTLAKLNHGSNGGRIFMHTVFYTLLTTILAASLAGALFVLIAPENIPSGTPIAEG